MTVHTKVSVIIPTLNAGNHLEALITALRNQESPPDQIIVIDSASSDQTRDIAIRLKTYLICIDPGSYDHGATRNLAADYAKGDILIFMTQDALPVNRKTLKSLVIPFQERGVVVSYARQIPVEEASLNEKYFRFANYPSTSMIKMKEDIKNLGISTFQNSNACAAYRRKEFEELGRFPTPVVCNEDMIFVSRAIFAGYKVAYCSEAVIYHTHQLGLRQLFRRYFDIAASLDHEPRIKVFGKAEEKGFDLLKKQIIYLRDQKKISLIPWTLLEATSKYLGYKTGLHHNRIPKNMKKHLGANILYWSRSDKSSVRKI